jgi:hypothetical protein
MGGESIRGEFGLLSLQARGQNCFGIPEKGAECKLAQADALVTLGTVHGFPYCVGYGTFFRGWALAIRGQHGEGLAATMGMRNRGGARGFSSC